MSQPILSDKQVDMIWLKLADGEGLDNETAKMLFADNCYFAGEYNQLLTKQKKEDQDEQSIGLLSSEHYLNYSHGVPIGR